MNLHGIPPIFHRHKHQQEPSDIFRKIAVKTSAMAGSRWAFVIAAGVVLGWAITGPYFNFSNTWQLFINTGTTIATFLMVFLIQNTQNRDAKATQIKLDELLRAIDPARDSLIDIEDLPDAQIDEMIEEFRSIRKEEARKNPQPPLQ